MERNTLGSPIPATQQEVVRSIAESKFESHRFVAVLCPPRKEEAETKFSGYTAILRDPDGEEIDTAGFAELGSLITALQKAGVLAFEM